MRPDDQPGKNPAGNTHHPHQRWQDQRSANQAVRSWTNKSMHHPATRIGEIKHGKS
jgi:hypothetical protein